MNVRCPNCQTVFRVDPDKIPLAGVKARCARCASTFQLTRNGATQAAAAPAPVAAAPAAAPPAAASFAAPVSAPAQPGTPAPQPPAPRPQPAQPAAAPATPPRPVPVQPPPVQPMASAAAMAPPTVAPPAAAVPAAAAAPTAPAAVSAPSAAKRPSFRNQDPNARAQRIARALVSDIVAYNKARLKEPMDAGRMRSEFREEIRKSWEEYVEQVGLDIAKSTPYFRDSLNEILAKGEKVF